MTISKSISAGLADFTGKLPVLLLSALLVACGGGSSDNGGGDTGGGNEEPPVNTAPEAGGQSLNTDEDTALDITLSGSDADDDALTYAITGQPANGVLTGTPPNLTYTAATNYEGSDSFRFIVNDGTDDSAEAIVNITVHKAYFSIGGTVSGLMNTGLVLENNGGDRLEVAGASFELPTKLTGGSNYAITAAGHPEEQLCSVENASGTLASDDVDDVSVVCRYWRTKEQIATGNAGNASRPQIAVNRAGNAVAVWYQHDGTRSNVWANAYTPDSGWSTATLIETGDGGADRPQIAIDNAGNATAVWRQAQSEEGMVLHNIMANTFTAGSGWGTATLIESGDEMAYAPQIAIDSAGNAIAVWPQYDGTHNVLVNRYSPDSGWGTEAVIGTDTGYKPDPQIAVNNAGNAVAVWRQGDGNSIWANAYTPGGGWGGATLIETDGEGALDPQIAIDRSGNAIAVWRQYDGTRYNIWANTYTPGSGWGTAELIETDDEGADRPQIAIGSAGNAIVVWEQDSGVGTRPNIWANAYTPKSGWSGATLIETDDKGASDPQIAIDSTGNAIAVWRQGPGIAANTYSPNSGWGTVKLIETGDAGNAEVPQVAFDSAGNAIAVWNQHDGTRYNIHANHFE